MLYPHSCSHPLNFPPLIILMLLVFLLLRFNWLLTFNSIHAWSLLFCVSPFVHRKNYQKCRLIAVIFLPLLYYKNSLCCIHTHYPTFHCTFSSSSHTLWPLQHLSVIRALSIFSPEFFPFSFFSQFFSRVQWTFFILQFITEMSFLMFSSQPLAYVPSPGWFSLLLLSSV